MSCHQWIHFIKCNKLTKSEYAALIDESEDIPWYCVKCTTSKRAEMFPFLSLDNNEMIDLHHIDRISFLDLLPSYELRSKLSGMPNLSDADIENNFVYRIHSDYYNLEEFKSSTRQIKKHFSLFHLNIGSLASHFEELQASLGLCEFPFDIIGISETKHIGGHNLTTNVSLEGYSLHSQPTKFSYGGVVLYVNEKLDHFCRNDPKVILKRIYLKPYGWRSNKRKAKIFSVAVHTDILTQMWMNLRITLKKSFKKFPRKIN